MNVGVCNKLYQIIHRPCKKRYAFTEQGIAYDRNGNITALRRYGASASAAEDDFAFNVTDNRISSLTNTGTSGSGVTYTSYTYDANGNTTHDGRTGQDLAWNELNLIAGVSQGSGAASSTLASYTWMPDGAKYASARADGTGYVYKGALVFEILKEFKENGLWVSHQIDDNCFVIRRKTLSQSKYEAALKVIGNKGENGLNIK